MTTSTMPPRSPCTLAEIASVLDTYCPTELTPQTWAKIQPDAKALVLKAGPLNQVRAEHDVQAIAAVARHLMQRGRPLTLDEVLADRTLLAFDQHLRSSGRTDKTRGKLHGVLRRLQAAHHEVPWRTPRRGDGERVAQLPSPELAHELAGLEQRARQHSGEGDAGASALLEVVTAARAARRTAVFDPQVWDQAKRYAVRQGVVLTRSTLSSAVTHEVLLIREPVAVLASLHRLSRADLDLGLTHAAALANTPSGSHRQALRGTWPKPTLDAESQGSVAKHEDAKLPRDTHRSQLDTLRVAGAE